MYRYWQTSGEDSTIPPYIEENVTNIPSTTTTSTTTTSIFASTVQSKSTIIDVTDTPTTTLISVINEKVKKIQTYFHFIRYNKKINFFLFFSRNLYLYIYIHRCNYYPCSLTYDVVCN